MTYTDAITREIDKLRAAVCTLPVCQQTANLYRQVLFLQRLHRRAVRNTNAPAHPNRHHISRLLDRGIAK